MRTTSISDFLAESQRVCCGCLGPSSSQHGTVNREPIATLPQRLKPRRSIVCRLCSKLLVNFLACAARLDTSAAQTGQPARSRE